MDSFWVGKTAFRIRHTLCKEAIDKGLQGAKIIYTRCCKTFFNLSETNKLIFANLMLQRLYSNNNSNDVDAFVDVLISSCGNDNNKCKIELSD